MVQPENINSWHSNSQLGDGCGRHHHYLAHLGEDVISPHRALQSAIVCSQLTEICDCGLTVGFACQKAAAS